MSADSYNDDIKRNRPSDEGRNNDTQLRDETATQPGVSTISTSNTDDENNMLTRTAGDSFRTENFEEKGADLTFDQVGDDK